MHVYVPGEFVASSPDRPSSFVANVIVNVADNAADDVGRLADRKAGCESDTAEKGHRQPLERPAGSMTCMDMAVELGADCKIADAEDEAALEQDAG